jgi:hypothetical protein
MKIKDYKCKCGCDDFFFMNKGVQVGIYCTLCGKWYKWADKDERNLMKLQQDQSAGLTAQQKLAIKAMMYAFDKYGAKRLIGAQYVNNVHKYPEGTIDFGEAFNICADIVKED